MLPGVSPTHTAESSYLYVLISCSCVRVCFRIRIQEEIRHGASFPTGAAGCSGTRVLFRLLPAAEPVRRSEVRLAGRDGRTGTTTIEDEMTRMLTTIDGQMPINGVAPRSPDRVTTTTTGACSSRLGSASHPPGPTPVATPTVSSIIMMMVMLIVVAVFFMFPVTWKPYYMMRLQHHTIYLYTTAQFSKRSRMSSRKQPTAVLYFAIAGGPAYASISHQW